MSEIAVVNENDEIIGAEEKHVVRTKGLRHRIVRIFVVNSQGKILLHRRSEKRKDTPGKWDQSAGGHVEKGEDYVSAAKRETLEELGIAINTFTELSKFYIERDAPDGFLRRFQTVFICNWDGPVYFSKAEIAEIRWLSFDEIDTWFQGAPDDFTTNFGRAFELLKRIK